MATLPIHDRQGNQVGSLEIAPEDIAKSINKQLLHDAVVMYQANLRQGTHRSKSRSEVSGSTKKMYRQKGTGNARAGSKRSGVRRGGGHIFARRPRDYSYRLPRKALQAATRMAVASKLQNNQVVVVDQLQFDQPATKEMASILKALKLNDVTTLVATAGLDANVYKSARNIAGVTVSPVTELNALAVLKPRRVLFTQAALESLRAGKAAAQSAAAE